MKRFENLAQNCFSELFQVPFQLTINNNASIRKIRHFFAKHHHHEEYLVNETVETNKLIVKNKD
jgi:hypothetical protein